ncbi:MAG: hypothetical protein ACLPVY_00075 [Acidimicrobiia bacterium]
MYQLLGDDRVLDLLADRDESAEVMISIDEVTRAHSGGEDASEPRPEAAASRQSGLRSEL